MGGQEQRASWHLGRVLSLYPAYLFPLWFMVTAHKIWKSYEIIQPCDSCYRLGN